MNVSISFRPKLADVFKKYSIQDLQADAMAGLTVGIMALPLTMAFAIVGRQT